MFQADSSSTQPLTDAAKGAAAHDATGVVKQVSGFGEKAWEAIIVYGPRVAGAMLLVFAAFIVAGWVQRATAKGLTKAHFDATLSKFLANTLRWLIIGFALLACLSIFGVDTTSYAALVGAAGLAIGLGFQGSLSNLAAGVMLLVFRPFKVGDSIVVGGQSGSVDAIDLFTTSIDTADNRRIIVPNGAIFGSTIENTSHHETRRTDVAVVVAGSADMDLTRRVLAEAARATPGVMPAPAPAVVLTDLSAGGGPNWRVEAWVRSGDLPVVREKLLVGVKQALDRASIAGPTPRMSVEMDTRAGPRTPS